MIDGDFVKFLFAVFVVAMLVSIIENINKGAAWVFVTIIFLGFLLNNPFVLVWISSQVNRVQGVVQ